MKKKILIGMVAISASVAVLGGCDSSENTSKVDSTTKANNATDNGNIPVELDENKRPKFDEETIKYYTQIEDKEVEFQSPIELEWSDSWGYEIYQDTYLSVSNINKLLDEDALKESEDFVAHTTVDGLNAFYTYTKYADTIKGVTLDHYCYHIPFKEKTLQIRLACPHSDENIDEHINFFDKVASSIYVYDLETTTTQAETSAVASEYDNWHELSVEGSDSSGYTFNRTIKISNWFGKDKKDKLENIWKTISEDPFPDDSSLGLLNGGYYTAFTDGHKTFYDYTDVFYAIGTVNLENTTKNFNGTADVYYDIKATATYTDGEQYVIGSTLLLTNTNKLYEPSGTGFVNSSRYSPHKKVTTTTKDTFVIMGLIRKTPNEPDGDFNLNDTVIHFCGEEFPISID